jgi:hypothetical protein
LARFEKPPMEKVSARKEAVKPRTTVSFYKMREHSPNLDILNMSKDSTLSEQDIMNKYFDTNSPTEVARILLYTALKDLGLLKSAESKKS